MTKKKRKIAVIDYETDPFKADRVPAPFCVEFHSAKDTWVAWGDDCSEHLVAYLETLTVPHLIYAHNGGKFDFHFLLPYIENPVLIIHGRIVSCKIGIHELRDSYAIMPFPLAEYEKVEFDYDLMEKPVREKNKNVILDYLHSDCVSLLALVTRYVDRFGPRVTVGGTAMREIRKIHPFSTSGSGHDTTFRPYYFGGRVQCFQSGIIDGPVKLYDVNSMYMNAMRNSLHPINGVFSCATRLPDNFSVPYFVKFEGKNYGALPSVTDEGGLTFEREEGIFYACSHELEVAFEHELVKIDNVLSVYIAQETISFVEFIDMCNNDKAAAKGKDQIAYLQAKYLGNSGYGRFGINPENFEDWYFHRDFGNEADLIAEGYSQKFDWREVELWAKKAEISEENYCDVAVAASITSAARANLLRGLQNATDAMYCDTDSIICREFSGDVHPTRLGAWDLEKTAKHVAIAGKKLYALYDDPKGKPVKLSSKGGTLTLQEIIKICKGETVRYENMAPTFSLKRAPTFVKRNFTKTARDPIITVDDPEIPF